MNQLTDKEIIKLIGADTEKSLSLFSKVDRHTAILQQYSKPITEEDFLKFYNQPTDYTSKIETLCEISKLDKRNFAYDPKGKRLFFNSKLFVTDNFQLLHCINLYFDNPIFHAMFNKYFEIANTNTYIDSITIETLINNGLFELEEMKSLSINEDNEVFKKSSDSNLFTIKQWDKLREVNNYYAEIINECQSIEDLTSILIVYGTQFRGIGVDKIIRYVIEENPNPFITKEILYNVWREGYQKNESSFLGFKSSFEKTYERKYDSVQKRIECLRPLCDKNGYINIYRGERNNSTPSRQALSWTLSKNMACSFATLYLADEYSLVYGKVHINDVLDTFIHDSTIPKEELEIIVDSRKVKIIKKVTVGDTATLVSDLSMIKAPPVPINFKQNHGKMYFDLYKSALVTLEALNDDKLIFECSDLHGFDHTKRVILHAINNAYLCKDEYKLRGVDIGILIVSAMLHDIGRVHDEEDLLHGQQSVEKVNSLGIGYLGLTGDDVEITKFIMANHNVPDSMAFKNLKSSNVRDKKRAKILYNLFCDADGLDRVRLGDLDISYLRNDKSKMLRGFAEDVLKQL
ncbi:hypothetical protein [Lysinibacillus sphaericus]|uniref:hypothetical protein n=1 Tax=Lysinibacillus sphaericus TaxID=1421 RepID=UPI0018CF9E12|nr:hypothetical protein [Lysinibacillus sphaericus]